MGKNFTEMISYHLYFKQNSPLYIGIQHRNTLKIHINIKTFNIRLLYLASPLKLI